VFFSTRVEQLPPQYVLPRVMNRIFAVAVLAFGLVAFADGDCKKERPLSKAEQGFYDRAKALVKGLPPAPVGWQMYPEEIVPPEKLCADADPMLKKGDARFNLAGETEYRSSVDNAAKVELAMKLGTPSAEEAKKANDLNKKIDALLKLPPDANAVGAWQTAHDELMKITSAQAARVSTALREATVDTQARIRISLNPANETSTGCNVQKSVGDLKVAGAQAFSGTCDLASAPQDSDTGLLLLFGKWTVKNEAGNFEATPAYDPKKPASAVQAMSVLIIGDGKRPEGLLGKLDIKALAAAVGK
jgi:hypothetical protein